MFAGFGFGFLPGTKMICLVVIGFFALIFDSLQFGLQVYILMLLGFKDEAKSIDPWIRRNGPCHGASTGGKSCCQNLGKIRNNQS